LYFFLNVIKNTSFGDFFKENKSATQLATQILYTNTTQLVSNQHCLSDFGPLPFLNPIFKNRFETSYQLVMVSFNNISKIWNPMTFYFWKSTFKKGPKLLIWNWCFLSDFGPLPFLNPDFLIDLGLVSFNHISKQIWNPMTSHFQKSMFKKCLKLLFLGKKLLFW